MAVVGTTITVAAAAANWGDLFAISNDGPNATWRDVDVSATGGNAARTVGSGIDAAVLNGSLTLIAAGVNQPAPTGTGVYAIPQQKNATAVSDGWPSIGVTGGLGTLSTPWVAVKSNAAAITQSQDFLVGQAIAQSHRRTTWLSFWTVSGPSRSEPLTAATFYQHAYAAGRAVAQTIDAYRSNGLGLKPDWVIIDAEGYPDYHSCIDGPTSIAPWCPAWSASVWSNYVTGWAKGLASIDPSLHAGVYASQYEYLKGGLASSPYPAFIAVAFRFQQGVTPTHLAAPTTVGATSLVLDSSVGVASGEKIYIRDGKRAEFLQVAPSYNGSSTTVPLTSALNFTHSKGLVVNVITPPKKLSSTVGPNILGYIAFGNSDACLAVPWEVSVMNGAPWNGLYNTLQFDAGAYCAPTAN